MSNVILLGDTHFGVRNDSQVFRDFQNLFFDELFFPYCIKNNIKEVWQFGDFFDKRKTVNFMTKNNTRIRILEKFVEHDIQLHILMGNHDQYYRNDRSINSLRELIHEKYPSHITIYDEITTVNVGGNMTTDIIPWINPKDNEEFFDYTKKSISPYAFGHFELSGFEMMKGHTIKKGMDAELLSNYDEVFSGHYHTKSKKGNIRYLGVPYEMTWSDYDDEKGFYVMDTDTKELTFVRNPFILHKKITYNNNSEELIHSIEEYENCFIKVNVIGKDDSEKYELFLTHLYNVNPVDVSITESSINNDIEIENLDVEDSLSILLRSVKSVDDDAIDVNILSDMVIELHTESLAQV